MFSLKLLRIKSILNTWQLIAKSLLFTVWEKPSVHIYIYCWICLRVDESLEGRVVPFTQVSLVYALWVLGFSNKDSIRFWRAKVFIIHSIIFFIKHPTECLQIKLTNHVLVQKLVRILFKMMQNEAGGRKGHLSRNHGVCAWYL